ncbi:MAG: GNAT family N-acetyltransferase [archaeon]
MKFSLHIEKNVKNCKAIWESLSTKDNYTDIWDYRYAFAKGYGNKPIFYCAKYRGKIIACVPIEHHRKDDLYFLFGGGDWNENLRILADDKYSKESVPYLLDNIPRNSRIIFLTKEDSMLSKKILPFEPTYYVDLESIGFDHEKFLDRMDSHKQRKIRSELKKIDTINPFIASDKFEDFDEMVKLNIKRFGKDSSFADKGFIRAFHNLLKHKTLKRYLSSLSVYISGKLKAYALMLEYNGTLTYLQGGNDTDIPNIAKYLSFRVLLEGTRRKASKVYYMSDDCGWKEHWRLDKEMQYFVKLD